MKKFQRLYYGSFEEAKTDCLRFINNGSENVKICRSGELFVITGRINKPNKSIKASEPMCCSIGDCIPKISLFRDSEYNCYAHWGDESKNNLRVLSLKTHRFRVVNKQEFDDWESCIGEGCDEIEEFSKIMFVDQFLKDASKCNQHKKLSVLYSWAQKHLTKFVGNSAFAFEQHECLNFYINFIRYYRYLDVPGKSRDEHTYFYLAANGTLPPGTASTKLWRRYVAFDIYKNIIGRGVDYNVFVKNIAKSAILGCAEAKIEFNKERDFLIDNGMASIVREVDESWGEECSMDIMDFTPDSKVWDIYCDWNNYVETSAPEDFYKVGKSDCKEQSEEDDDSEKILENEYISCQQDNNWSDFGDIKDDCDGGYYEEAWGGPNDIE